MGCRWCSGRRQLALRGRCTRAGMWLGCLQSAHTPRLLHQTLLAGSTRPTRAPAGSPCPSAAPATLRPTPTSTRSPAGPTQPRPPPPGLRPTRQACRTRGCRHTAPAPTTPSASGWPGPQGASARPQLAAGGMRGAGSAYSNERARQDNHRLQLKPLPAPQHLACGRRIPIASACVISPPPAPFPPSPPYPPRPPSCEPSLLATCRHGLQHCCCRCSCSMPVANSAMACFP